MELRWTSESTQQDWRSVFLHTFLICRSMGIKGRDILLVFKDDIGKSTSTFSWFAGAWEGKRYPSGVQRWHKACEYDMDKDTVNLVQAAQIVRKDMFKMYPSFNGSFLDKSQEDSMLQLVSMILEGPSMSIINLVYDNCSASAIQQCQACEERRIRHPCMTRHQPKKLHCQYNIIMLVWCCMHIPEKENW